MRPPTWLAPDTNRTLTADRSARDLLIQCDTCGVIGTARKRGDRTFSTSIRRDHAKRCPGRVVGYDITEQA